MRNGKCYFRHSEVSLFKFVIVWNDNQTHVMLKMMKKNRNL